MELLIVFKVRFVIVCLVEEEIARQRRVDKVSIDHVFFLEREN